MQSGALYDNNEDFISNGGGKVASILKKIIFTFIDVDNKEESGLERYTQENVNKIVENAVKDNGGNVTVMRDGVELFRVRATGHGDDKNATYTLRKYNKLPDGTVKVGDDRKARGFNDDKVDELLYGINKVNGYHIRTKGER